MILARFSALLLAVASAAVAHASKASNEPDFTVDCDQGDTIVVKWTERPGGSQDFSQLFLGNCLPTRVSAGKGGARETVFRANLHDCSFRRTVTENVIMYSNKLNYVSQYGLFLPYQTVTCIQERPEGWSPPLHRPNWRIEGYGTLHFHMEIMNEDFSRPAPSSSFYLGSFIPIRAAVDQQAHLPLLLLLDQCVATTRPELDTSGLVYPFISDHGCLMDSLSGSSRFLPRVQSSELRLLLQAFQFALGGDVYIHCTLSVWDTQLLDESKKACHYAPENGRWELLDDTSQSSICSCCSSSCKSRRRRGVDSGARRLTQNVVLGPLVIRE